MRLDQETGCNRSWFGFVDLTFTRAPLFKFLRIPKIDSKEPIPPGCVCSLSGRYDNLIFTRFLASIDCLKIPAQVGLAGTRYDLVC